MNIMIGFSHSVTILIGFDLLEIRFMVIQIYYVRVHLVVTLDFINVHSIEVASNIIHEYYDWVFSFCYDIDWI